jgi:hypothetical protein
MPYITPDRRFGAIDSYPETSGELTYLLQQMLDSYLSHKLETTGEVRFADLNDCLGALRAAQFDFEDRVLKPYEERKRLENGDVWNSTILNYVRGWDRGAYPLVPYPRPL